jgi:hypothetical protein
MCQQRVASLRATATAANGAYELIDQTFLNFAEETRYNSIMEIRNQRQLLE